MVGALRGFDEGGGVAGADAAARRITLAAIFRQVSEQIIHGRIFRRVDQRSAFTTESNKTRVAELVQMERKAVRRDPKPLGNLPGGQPISPGLNEQPEHIETRFLCERGQRGDGIRFFHNSNIVEL